MKWLALVFLLAIVASTGRSAPTSTSLEANGSGRFDTNCIHTLLPSCTTTAVGTMTGTPISSGTWGLRLDTGSPALLNGFTGIDQGSCLSAAGHGSLIDANSDRIDFNHVGMVCEEAEPSSPYHYNGTYRITGGTGVYASATGSGDVQAVFTREGTFTRGSGDALFNLDGTIAY